jgi:hypothetical protein
LVPERFEPEITPAIVSEPDAPKVKSGEPAEFSTKNKAALWDAAPRIVKGIYAGFVGWILFLTEEVGAKITAPVSAPAEIEIKLASMPRKISATVP